MKVVFIKDHSPRKSGDVVEFKTREELLIASWYLSNDIARECNCKGEEKTSNPCECSGEKEVALTETVATVEPVAKNPQIKIKERKPRN